MGNLASRIQASQNRTSNNGHLTRSDPLRAAGTYFGPNFVLERDEVSPSENTARAFMEDIVNSMAARNGIVDLQIIRNLGDIYSQLPAPEMRKAITLKSTLNLQRGSLQLSKVNNETRLRYNLNFKFDSLVPCEIVLYWGAKESVFRDDDGRLNLKYS
jgi:hypothetical protein